MEVRVIVSWFSVDTREFPDGKSALTEAVIPYGLVLRWPIRSVKKHGETFQYFANQGVDIRLYPVIIRLQYQSSFSGRNRQCG